MGFRGKVSRSTLADANESSDWRIYADSAQVLIGMARPLYAHGLAGGDQQWSSLPRSRLILAHRWSNWGTNRRVNHRLDWTLKYGIANSVRQFDCGLNL